VSWGAPEGLTEGLLRYVVEVKERGSPRPFQVGVLGRYHHAEITTVKPFTVYEVRVRADTNATTGMFSKWHRVFVNATISPAPRGLKASKIGEHTAVLHWYPPAKAPANSYQVSFML
jgi:hypothetical protein